METAEQLRDRQRKWRAAHPMQARERERINKREWRAAHPGAYTGLRTPEQRDQIKIARQERADRTHVGPCFKCPLAALCATGLNCALWRVWVADGSLSKVVMRGRILRRSQLRGENMMSMTDYNRREQEREREKYSHVYA